MSKLSRVMKWVESYPLVLLRFPERYHESITNSRRGLSYFTFAELHEEVDAVHAPTLCVAQMKEGNETKCYIGVVRAKSAVTQINTRLTIVGLRSLTLSSLSAITSLLSKKVFESALEFSLSQPGIATVLTPKLSAAAIEGIANEPNDRQAILAAANQIGGLRRLSPPEWQQSDAIKLAVAVFGLSKSDVASSLFLATNSDSTLAFFADKEARFLEDNVIARDANRIPGFKLLERLATGRAVFRRAEEKLIVYTANRGPLESMLGVDLIYINEKVGNALMVQYKMLEPTSSSKHSGVSWLYRPDDQFFSEVSRMSIPPLASSQEDYRLCRSPFFFKFVKRKGDEDSSSSCILSMEHVNQLLESSRAAGPRGGARVCTEDLGGVYLRETDLIGLMRSGYVGTHRAETDVLHPFIEAVARGDRAMVLAWQQIVKRPERS